MFKEYQECEQIMANFKASKFPFQRCIILGITLVLKIYFFFLGGGGRGEGGAQHLLNSYPVKLWTGFWPYLNILLEQQVKFVLSFPDLSGDLATVI